MVCWWCRFPIVKEACAKMLEIWEGELPQHISHQQWLSADVLSITARQWKSLLTSFLMLVVDVDHPHRQVDNIIKLAADCQFVCSMLWGSTIADVLHAILCGPTYFFVIPVERIWVLHVFFWNPYVPITLNFRLLAWYIIWSFYIQKRNDPYFHIQLAFKFIPNSPV
jgi:hypothetical protein